MAGPGVAPSEELIAQQKAAREQFTADTWAKLKARGDPSHHPARALPRDGVLVVRTDALLEFEESLNDAASGSEKAADG